MTNFTLNVDGSLPGELTFELRRESEAPVSYIQETQLKIEDINATPSCIKELLPPDIISRFKQWVIDDPTVDLLAITCTNKDVAGIPWEYLPQLLALPSIFVVRLFAQSALYVDKRPHKASRLLAAGWSGWPDYNLPGIREELSTLSQLIVPPDFTVKWKSELKLDQFEIEFSGFEPDFLHLIPTGLVHDGPESEMVLSDGTQTYRVSTKDFLARLPHDLKPFLVVLNTCGGGDSGGGSSAVRIIAEHMQAMVIGWIGTIQDHTAVSFARYLYSGLLNGKSIIDVLFSYIELQPPDRNWDQPFRDFDGGGQWGPFGAVLTVWTPSIELVTEPLRSHRYEDAATSEEREVPMSRGTGPKAQDGQPSHTQVPVSSRPDFPILTPNLKLRNALNPALVRNGLSPVLGFSIDSNQEMRVEVDISCDTGDRTSTFRQTILLRQGNNAVSGYGDWAFPVIYELLRMAVPRRKINFTVICSLAGTILAETTTSVLWMDNTEWLDQPDTWGFLPAFVNPYAEGVLDVIREADKVLTSITSSASSFNGYNPRANGGVDTDYVDTQAMAIFNCLREVFQLRYIGVPPIPVTADNDPERIGQRIRTPDEVVRRRTGTCHDLAILFASCLEHIGIHPIIVLLRGHTCVGYWKTSEAQKDFWNRATVIGNRPQQGNQGYWTMCGVEIVDLLKAQAIRCVEITTVGDRNTEFLRLDTGASDKGRASINKAVNAGNFDIAVDITRSRHKVQPL